MQTIPFPSMNNLQKHIWQYIFETQQEAIAVALTGCVKV